MIENGQTVECKGSGKKPYLLKNIDGVYSCTCPAWRNQSAAIDKRTCKHLKSVLGEAHELIRVQVNPEQAQKIFDALSLAAEKGRKLRPDEKAKLNGPPVLLAHTWEPDVDPTGWWISEKLDGVRAYWDGENFISRQGNIYHAPDWFKAGLPKDTILDGELWMARQCFQKTISIVKRQDAGDEWKKISYMVYDAPDDTNSVEQRFKNLLEMGLTSPYVSVLEQFKCVSPEHLHQELDRVKYQGGEGVMIREPGSFYEKGRSHTLLKVKSFHDAEAEVIGYTPGKGRHRGRTGALQVRMHNGKEFLIGTGLSDAERESPPAIGAIVTYRYTELTTDGIPKCGSFVCERNYE